MRGGGFPPHSCSFTIRFRISSHLPMKKAFSLASLLLTLAVTAACQSTGTTPDGYSASSSSSPSQNTMANSSTNTWAWDGKVLSGRHEAVLTTSKGDITVELDADAAPKTVTNFLALASSGYYDNLTFHRVIPGFMIQGGDPSGNGTGGKSIYGEMFEDEINPDSLLYKNGYKAGVLAMANRGPDTNGSQFFIMETDYPLPPNYTIFGRVIKGQEVVKAIANVERGPNDMPTTKVSFSVEVVK